MTSLDESQVFLGYVDEEITNQVDEEDPYGTKVGGYPAWISTAPPTPCCALCRDGMALVIQAYSPLNILPTHERVLYIFACVKQSCSSKNGGWCVVRSHIEAEGYENDNWTETTTTDENNTKNQSSESNTESWGGDDDWNDNDNDNGDNAGKDKSDSTESWGGGDDDWNDNAGDDKEKEDVDDISSKLEDLLTLRDQSKTSKTSKTSTKQKKGKEKKTKETPTATKQPKGYFTPHYLVVEEEPESKSEVSSHHDITDSAASDTEEWAGEEYEYAPNRVESKFFKKMALSPLQCIRYKFNGAPLLMYEDPNLSVPPCPSCGAARTFELQLMSTLIFLLKAPKGKQPQLDFGIVAIYVCSKSCVGGGDFLYEYAYVQPENK